MHSTGIYWTPAVLPQDMSGNESDKDPWPVGLFFLQSLQGKEKPDSFLCTLSPGDTGLGLVRKSPAHLAASCVLPLPVPLPPLGLLGLEFTAAYGEEPFLPTNGVVVAVEID